MIPSEQSYGPSRFFSLRPRGWYLCFPNIDGATTPILYRTAKNCSAKPLLGPLISSLPLQNHISSPLIELSTLLAKSLESMPFLQLFLYPDYISSSLRYLSRLPLLLFWNPTTFLTSLQHSFLHQLLVQTPQ